jgi:Domain of unknown function (DUF5667)
MPGPKPNKLHDELDALLDGRPVELTDELAPLAEAANELRMELAGLRLDPEVADRHLERILRGSAPVVQLPARGPASGWDVRRRVVAVALAAALVLAPATMASAAALPGQAMYPFKLAIEQVRIASVQWSPPREAGERTRVAQERLEELNRLVELRMFSQIPTAVSALDKAVLDAQAAVSEAKQEGQPVPALAATLDNLKTVGGQTLANVVATVSDPSLLPKGTRDAIRAAVAETKVVVTPDREIGSAGAPPSVTPTPATDPKPGGGSDPTTPPPPPSASTPPPESTQPTTPTTTEPPPTSPPTTDPPPTTEDTTPPASGGGGGGGDGAGAGAGAGADGRAPSEQAPPTTLPAP